MWPASAGSRSLSLILTALTILVLASSTPSESPSAPPPPPPTTSSPWHQFLYDVGIFGAHPIQTFRSIPSLTAPELNTVKWTPACEPGFVLLSPRGHFYPHPGPLVYDPRGELVWVERRFGMVMDLNIQQYKGGEYLTFWVGHDDGTRGEGVYYMLNSSYEVAHTVSATNGLKGDVHEFKITPEDTALMSIYEITQMDLSSVGRDADGWVYDGLFQEIDIETGSLLFQWRARDHYSINDTYFPVGDKSAATASAGDAYDYFHINSIDKRIGSKPDSGSEVRYLVSSRYLHSVTCIDGTTGAILWILGGKRNMFRDLSNGDATSFTWQHDARWYGESDHILTLLDNGANEHTRTADHTRGLMISLDFENWTATALNVYDSPGHFSSHSQGNLQILPETGNVFIGWGKASSWTEFSLEGEVLCDTHYGPSMFYWFGWVKSYRVQKVKNWIGKPSYPPDIAIDQSRRRVFVSWNGATEISDWILQRASHPHAEDGEFGDVLRVSRTGFETQFDLPAGLEDGFLRVTAVDGRDGYLGSTRVFDASGQMVTMPLLPPAMGDDSAIQQFLLGSCAVAGVVVAVWKSRVSLFVLYLRLRRWRRRRI